MSFRYVTWILLIACVLVFGVAGVLEITRTAGSVPGEPAGEGPIWTARGEVVENHCRVIEIPAGYFYYDPQDPSGTFCVHPPTMPAEPVEGGGAQLPAMCAITPDGTIWCSGSGVPPPGTIEALYTEGYLPHIS